ncbi:SS18-like protein 2 [Fragariocoptes setiger]|uniref:SS18-like protein 2 n=1 Tax=Fragariocoptes setiger TaxID=1670756 RepID=A0ABQ7S5E0_9ACAR|nr:SS18-like protein 2 [Fragariocoptes setiger]
MSLMFKPTNDNKFDPKLVEMMLDENALLIKTIKEYQDKGEVEECNSYQSILHRNLIYLARLTDFKADDKWTPSQSSSARAKRAPSSLVHDDTVSNDDETTGTVHSINS